MTGTDAETEREERIAERLREPFKEYTRLFMALIEDALTALVQQIENDSQFNRRSLIRAVFAFIEGDVYLRKQIALAGSEATSSEIQRAGVSLEETGLDSTFADAERALLREKQVFLDQNGKVKIKPMHLTFRDNILFSFDIMSKFTTGVSPIDKQSRGWHALMSSVQVRHRITHPKSATWLEITDEGISTVIRAFKWYVSLTPAAFAVK